MKSCFIGSSDEKNFEGLARFTPPLKCFFVLSKLSRGFHRCGDFSSLSQSSWRGKCDSKQKYARWSELILSLWNLSEDDTILVMTCVAFSYATWGRREMWKIIKFALVLLNAVAVNKLKHFRPFFRAHHPEELEECLTHVWTLKRRGMGNMSGSQPLLNEFRVFLPSGPLCESFKR